VSAPFFFNGVYRTIEGGWEVHSLKYKGRGRTPRYFDGVEPTGRQIRDLIPEFLREMSCPEQESWKEVVRIWMEIIGEDLAPLTEPVKWVDRVLTIKVKSATLYSLLRVHEGRRLLAQMKQRCSVQKLVFWAG
jgi:hypothetical protein